MSKSVTVLTPNIKTAEDFNRIGKQLSEIAIDYLNKIESELIPEEELKVHLDAILIWKQFGSTFRRGKGLFITWEEIKNLALLRKPKDPLISWKIADIRSSSISFKSLQYPFKNANS